MATTTFQFDPSALAKYGRLTMVARSVVEGFLTGVHKSPYKGFSVEFAEHRQYYPGDEIRHIDWRVYGKTDRYYIKEFEEETNLKAHLLVDASGSMAYRGQHISKFQYAQYIAGSLAYLMLHQLDAVGLITHDTKVRQMVRPRANAKHLMNLLHLLEQTEPGGETSMAPIWHELAGQIKRRGLIIILSDCFDNLPALLRALRHFRFRRHEVILFHILAPEEIEFPFRKWTQFRNLENSDHKLLVDPQQLRKEYLKNFNAYCAELRQKVGQMQIDYHLLRTDEPVDRALGIYLTKRQRQRQR
ncbi:MAG: hypothetical protein KatS3mg105_3756 [Gemmatales bacterium]|nr:MAG: hypothetical protein KatS3mg105_3756 [Gemmatales bacterium]